MEACPVPSWSGRHWRQWERLPDLMDRSGIEGEEKDREEEVLALVATNGRELKVF